MSDSPHHETFRRTKYAGHSQPRRGVSRTPEQRCHARGGRFMRFGWVGCPDVLGQLKDGRLLGVEVKAAKGRTSPGQVAFLERIREAGGVAFVARDLRDVLRELATDQGGKGGVKVWPSRGLETP